MCTLTWQKQRTRKEFITNARFSFIFQQLFFANFYKLADSDNEHRGVPNDADFADIG